MFEPAFLSSLQSISNISKQPPKEFEFFFTHLLVFVLFPIDGWQDVRVLVEFGCFAPNKKCGGNYNQTDQTAFSFLNSWRIQNFRTSNVAFTTSAPPPVYNEINRQLENILSKRRFGIYNLHIGFSPNEIFHGNGKRQHLCFSARNV